MIRFFLLFSAAVTATSCAPVAVVHDSTEIPSRPKTDLGLLGNARVARNFENYVNNATAHCHGGGSGGKRILLSGFGPFNRRRNISGAVIDVLQRSVLWPSESRWPAVTAGFAAPNFLPDDRIGEIGASALQRTIRYDGQEFELCLLKLSVEWDFAAAVILHEAEKFQPDFILMTGYGNNLNGVRLEAGALNQTRRLSGFDAHGRVLGELNSPESAWVLPPELNLHEQLSMDWNPRVIASRLSARLQQVSRATRRSGTSEEWKFVAYDKADPENDYVCNNVSYSVLAALQSQSVIPLAGGKVRLRPRFAGRVGAAFLHYPYESDVTSAEEVWAWTHLLLTVAGVVDAAF
ncbi:MAG: Pyroglutamyl peptidase [Pseudomonadota bacterium]